MNHKKPIFIVDAMLGNLAKKLRMFGFDSLYSSDIEDDEIIRIAKKENRIVITKDVELVNKSNKQDIQVVFVSKPDEIEQFLQINEKVDLGKIAIKGDNSRCPKCNGSLRTVEKNLIQNKVPQGVLDNNEKFWECENCKKIYWEGTHILNMQKFTEKLNDRL